MYNSNYEKLHDAIINSKIKNLEHNTIEYKKHINNVTQNINILNGKLYKYNRSDRIFNKRLNISKTNTNNLSNTNFNKSKAISFINKSNN